MAWWGRSKTARSRTPDESKLFLEALEDRLTPSASPLAFALSSPIDSHALAVTSATSTATTRALPWGTAVDLGTGFAAVEISPTATGRIDNLALRSNGTLVFRSQSQPGASWSSWSVLGNSFRAATLARHADGRLEIFAIGRDGSLNTRLQSQAGGSWGNWKKTSAAYADAKAFTRTDGRIELFLLGTSGSLFQRTQNSPNGSWGSITRHAGSFQKIRFAQHQDGRGEILALATNGQLQQRTQIPSSNTWSNWTTIRSSVVDIDMVRNASGRLEVFAVTQSGSLMHRAQNSPNQNWSAWTSIAFGIKQVDAISTADGRLQLIALNSAGKTVARTRPPNTTAWGTWEDLGSTQRLMAAGSSDTGPINLFYVDTRGRLLHRSQLSSSAIPDSPKAWNLQAMRATEAWDRGVTGAGIIVAVLDTGINASHPDLARNIWTNTREIPGNGIDDDRNGFIDDRNGWDFLNQDNSPLDANGHGTHVAGIIGALRNGIGVTGVAPSVKIMPIQVLDTNGKGSTFDIDRGIRYAVDNGAKIINISIGSNFNNQALVDSIAYARSKGVLIIAGAGNDAASAPSFPAAYSRQFDNVISVGSHDDDGVQSANTNNVGTSRAVQVDAPGERIYSTYLAREYRTMSGTSMATPHVTGLAALILSANPDLTPGQVRRIIVDSADRPITSSDARGGIDAVAAIDLALSSPYLIG
jgi:subtilisin family serine protease